MTWTEHHAESERLAIEAHLAIKSHKYNQAKAFYRRAAEAESRALESIDVSKSRTRGITAVSAVALWFKAEEYSPAERLAYSMLADPCIPEFAYEHLRILVQAIWTESTKRKAGITFLPGQVMVSIKGGEIVSGGAPLDLVVDKVQTIQSMFYRTIEFLKGADYRKMGRPTKDIQESCRPWLFQSAPGSYQFSVAVQSPLQMDLFAETIEPDRVAQAFLEIVDASSGDDIVGFEKLVPDEKYRNTFLKLTRNLTPAGKTFDRIEFRAPGESRPVTIDTESRVTINQQLRKKSIPSTPEGNLPVELLGTLRAVHLDKDWLEIAVEDETIHVEGLQDAVDDVIGPMINRSVVVQVMRTSHKKFRFIDIEMID